MAQLTAARLREVLHYCPETGVFRWKAHFHSSRVGTQAGHVTERGYRKVSVDGRVYRAHRLAWLYVYGRWPIAGVDHKDGAKDDNRISELREAGQSQNGANARRYKNNTTGFKGVTRRKSGRYGAYIRKGGRLMALGMFDTPHQAHAAYMRVANALFGEFARAG